MRSTCWLAAPTHMVRRSLTVCAPRPSALTRVEAMSRNPYVVFSTVAFSPSTTGLGSVSYGSRDQDKRIVEAMGLDVQVPAIKTGKEL